MVLTTGDQCPEISKIINERDQAELPRVFGEKCDVNNCTHSAAGKRVNHENALLLVIQEGWDEGVDSLIKAGVNLNVCYHSDEYIVRLILG